MKQSEWVASSVADKSYYVIYILYLNHTSGRYDYEIFKK